MKFIKVKDEKNGDIFAEGNCQLVEGKKEKSPYALRETYTEFKEFEKGTYYMYVKIKWNGKAATKNFAVNCYAPCRINWIADDTDNWTQKQINTMF